MLEMRKVESSSPLSFSVAVPLSPAWDDRYNEPEPRGTWCQWENDPVGASRMAAMAMEVERHGLTEDMRALLEDDAYGEVIGSDRWKHDDRAAAEAYRKHMLSEMDMYATANRKASYGRKPYEWEKLAGNVYTIHDAEGNYIDVTKLKEKGPGWFACANAWGLPYTKFKTKEEAMDFAESLLGMGR